MALTACPECSTEISKAAESCPKCGHPIKKEKPRSAWHAALAVLLGIGALWLWFGGRLYIIFPYDSAIYGSVLLLYGVIQFAKRT